MSKEAKLPNNPNNPTHIGLLHKEHDPPLLYFVSYSTFLDAFCSTLQGCLPKVDGINPANLDRVFCHTWKTLVHDPDVPINLAQPLSVADINDLAEKLGDSGPDEL